MSILFQVQEFLYAHFVRLCFVLMGFIYRLTLVPHWSGRLAQQVMRGLLPNKCVSVPSTAVIFILIGTWIKSYDDKKIIKNPLIKT